MRSTAASRSSIPKPGPPRRIEMQLCPACRVCGGRIVATRPAGRLAGIACPRFLFATPDRISTSRGLSHESIPDRPHRRGSPSCCCLASSGTRRGSGPALSASHQPVHAGGNACRHSSADSRAAAFDRAEECRAGAAAGRAASRRECKAPAPSPLCPSPLLWLALCLLAAVPDLLATPRPQPHLLEPDSLVLLMRTKEGP